MKTDSDKKLDGLKDKVGKAKGLKSKEAILADIEKKKSSQTVTK